MFRLYGVFLGFDRLNPMPRLEASVAMIELKTRKHPVVTVNEEMVGRIGQLAVKLADSERGIGFIKNWEANPRLAL